MDRNEIITEIASLMRIKEIHQEQLKSLIEHQQSIYDADLTRLKEFLDYLRIL